MEAEDGVGLAASQIGVLKRVFIAGTKSMEESSPPVTPTLSALHFSVLNLSLFSALSLSLPQAWNVFVLERIPWQDDQAFVL